MAQLTKVIAHNRPNERWLSLIYVLIGIFSVKGGGAY